MRKKIKQYLKLNMLTIFSVSRWTMPLLIIIIMAIALAIGQNGYQQAPDSPCPHLFRYHWDGSEWQGILDVPYNSLAQTIKLNVMLTIKAQLPTVSNSKQIYAFYAANTSPI